MAGEPAQELRPERNDSEVEALYAAAPDTVRAEILHGMVMMSPRPRPAHQRAAYRLGTLLGGAFDLGNAGPGGWVILPEPELHLGSRPDKISPDLVGWRRERMPVLQPEGAIRLAPDWVCEVLSDPTEAVDRGAKMVIFAREGVGHVWLVDPARRTLEVFRRQGGGWEAAGVFVGDARVRAAPFDAVELAIGVLWEG